jgi:hypothetical protein
MLLYGLFAAVVAILATVAIERLGGHRGGLIATMPSTIVPASIGILERSTGGDDFTWAMAAVCIGMAVNCFFLWMWRAIPPRLPPVPMTARLGMMLGLSLSGWALAAALSLGLTRHLLDTGASPWMVGIVCTLGIGLMGIVACLRHVPGPAGKRAVSVGVLGLRGLLAGFCIALAVWLASKGLPLLSGMASVFPAIFLTTMVALWLSQGDAVQLGAVGPMMLGSTSIAAYAMFAALVLPGLGPWLGTGVAWGGSVLMVSVPAYIWLQTETAR